MSPFSYGDMFDFWADDSFASFYKRAPYINQSFPGYPLGTHIWIGGNDLARPGHWVWSRGKPIDDFYNWLSGKDGEDGDCVEVVTPSPRWHPADCRGRNAENHTFVAEKS